MSVVFVVVPVIAAGWPIISAAILAAGAAMGYRAVSQAESQCAQDAKPDASARASGVNLVMEDSQIVAETLMRGEAFTMQNGDITATFRRDGRGQCTVHVGGANKTESELAQMGYELMDKVRQQFAYSKVMAELEERGFDVVKQEVEADNSIRIKVRRWN